MKTLQQQYQGNGSTTTFAVTAAAAGFGHVIEVNGNPVSFTYASTTSVILDVAPNSGELVNVFTTNAAFHGAASDVDELSVGGGKYGATAGVIKGIITAVTASNAYGAIAANSAVDTTVACVGAVVGDPVFVGPAVVPPVGCTMSAFVSAPDVVTVRVANSTIAATAAYTSAARVTVVKF